MSDKATQSALVERAVKLIEGLEGFIDAVESLPPEVVVALFGPPSKPAMAKPYRLEVLVVPGIRNGSRWEYRSSFTNKGEAIRIGDGTVMYSQVYNSARVIDRRTGKVVWTLPKPAVVKP